jgi:hypothetical protein
MSRAETFGLAALALLGTAGGSVFGALASEGGEGHLRNIILGVICAIVLVSVTAINRYIDIRFSPGRRHRTGTRGHGTGTRGCGT